MDEGAKNKFDGFMKLAEHWSSRHNGRREFEWKMAFGWWGLLVLAIHYVHSCFLKNLPLWQYIVIAVSVALTLLLSFVGLWLYPLWKANKFDKDKCNDAVQCAEEILNLVVTKSNPHETDRSSRFSGDWSMKFQALTTLVLLAVLCIAARY